MLFTSEFLQHYLFRIMHVFPNQDDTSSLYLFLGLCSQVDPKDPITNVCKSNTLFMVKLLHLAHCIYHLVETNQFCFI